jgi:hypothetical protein
MPDPTSRGPGAIPARRGSPPRPLRRRLAAAALLAWGCSGADGADDEQAFLAQHWRVPVPAQGEPPAGWAAITTSLRPEDCAVCHRKQFEQWRTSIHAAAYSPGLHGQLLAWIGSDDATVASCHGCHAPLTEQLPRLPERPAGAPNPAFDPALRDAGVACAACHVRSWRRYGPPRRDGSTGPAPAGTPHDGAVRTAAFQASEFCGACHQFEEPAANGKPLENTVAEWRASPAAARGETCQSCHMPDRAHLWRGIHDAESTRRAAALVWELEGAAADGGFRVRLGLRNVGAGHRLPTYVTPKIDLVLSFEDAAGRRLATRTRRIGREVTFDGERWIESADTRLPPEGEEVLEWSGAAPAGSRFAHGLVRVLPDEFYRGFFADLLEGMDPADPAEPVLRAALRRTTESPYVLYERRELLAAAPAPNPSDTAAARTDAEVGAAEAVRAPAAGRTGGGAAWETAAGGTP